MCVIFTKGMGFLSPRDDHGVKRFIFTASWCSKQGRHYILKPLLRKREKLLLKLNDSFEGQLLGRGTFWLCVYMYSGNKELLEDREDNSELWIYIVHLDLLYRKKNVQRMLKQQIYSKRFNRFLSYSHIV